MIPHSIHIAEEALADLRERLERTRWPNEPEGADWELGTSRIAPSIWLKVPSQVDST